MIHAAIKNPYAVVAISLIVVILGVVSYQQMEVDVFPEINIPVVVVATFYKGMGPVSLKGRSPCGSNNSISKPPTSNTSNPARYPGQPDKIYFQPSYNVNAAVAEITSLTYSALRYLPPGMFPPIIVKFGAASLPIGVLTASSGTLGEKDVRDLAQRSLLPQVALSEKEVRDLAYYGVRPQLATVPGIFVAPSFGGTVRQVTVFLDRERMLARGWGHEVVTPSTSRACCSRPAT